MLSLVIPTYQEAADLEALLTRVAAVLPQLGDSCEIVLVDDQSRDGTPELAEQFFREYPIGRVIRRTSARDLSQSVLDGIHHARGDVLGVMDADLSHPPELLPALMRAIRAGHDLAIASRYAPGGRTVNWPWMRRVLSRAGIWAARPLTRVRDPMSGYFLIRADAAKRVVCQPKGYKILLELLVKGRFQQVTEVSYTFVDRMQGHSKLSRNVLWRYLAQLARLYGHRLRERIDMPGLDASPKSSLGHKV